MNRKQLAAALGISASMVSRLANERGMPTDSVERAVRWRSRHLEVARTKGNRGDASFAAPVVHMSAPSPTTVDLIALNAIEHAEKLAAIGFALLGSGRFELIEGDLRVALRAVPVSQRGQVRLECAVFDALVAHLGDAVSDEVDEPAAGVDSARACMSDEEAEQTGRFWYSVACHEIIRTPDASSGLPDWLREL